jgi:Phospholipase_D-nuclease N-terminal
MCRVAQDIGVRSALGNNRGDKKMQYQGLFGLVVLIADVWAIVNIFQSSADTGKKVLWTVLVIILPVLGFILWYFVGPKTGKA